MTPAVQFLTVEWTCCIKLMFFGGHFLAVQSDYSTLHMMQACMRSWLLRAAVEVRRVKMNQHKQMIVFQTLWLKTVGNHHRAPDRKHSVHIHALGLEIHPSDLFFKICNKEWKYLFRICLTSAKHHRSCSGTNSEVTRNVILNQWWKSKVSSECSLAVAFHFIQSS